MIKNKNIKLKTTIAVLVVLLISLTLAVLFIPQKINNVSAETGQTNIDDYINSDNLYYDTNKTIFDYCSGNNPLYATKAKLVTKSAPTGYLALTGEEDDYIVQIIPKHLFKTVGEKFEIGNEYGFYINTEDKGNYFVSTVLVFDINLDYSNLTVNNRVDLKVNPIFQYNYAYLKASETKIVYKQDSHNLNIDYSISDDIVIAIPSYVYCDIFGYVFGEDYKLINKYYLKDIAMGIALFNEQELNCGDVGYDARKDNGYFVTGYEYVFNGGKFLNNRFVKLTTTDKDIIMETLNKVAYFLGWIGVPIKDNNIISIISQLIATPGIIDSWYDNVKSNKVVEYNEKDVTFGENGVGRLKLDAYAENHDDQLSNYIDENGHSQLIKAAIIPFERVMDGGVWYGVNDFAEGQFTINHSAQNQPANQTRLVSDIELKIMDSSTSKPVMFGKETWHNTLREPVYKDIGVEQEQRVNLLPNGTNYFNFNAEYASDYTFNVANANGVQIKVNGAVVNGSVKLDAGLHKVEVINLTEEKIISDLTISPNAMYAPNNNKALTINTNQTYLLKVTSLAGVKQLCTNNQNVEIVALYDSDFEHYTHNGTISPSTQISYPFVEGTYYIAMRNKSSSITEINFTITDNVPVLTLGTEQTITMNGYNYSYVKFVANEGGNYVISFGDYSSRIDFRGFNANNLEQCGYTGTKFLNVGLNANTSYYFAVKNGTNISNSININLERFSFEWIISDGVKTISTFEEQYELYVGKNYTINFKVNGKEVTDVKFEPRNLPTNPYLPNIDGNKLRFLEGTYIGGIGAEILAISTDQYDMSSQYDQINLIPQIKNPVIITSLFGNDTYNFNLKAVKGITKIDYGYYHNNSSVIVNKSVKFNVDYNVDNNFDYVNSVTIDALKEVGESVAYNVTIKVIKYHYKVINEFKNEETGENTDSLTFKRKIVGPSFSNFFAGGSGTEGDPYTISNIRHFKHMADLDCYFYLLNNINLGEWSNPYTFIGKLNGNNKTITYNYSTNELKSNFGLFLLNTGTINFLNVDANLNLKGEVKEFVYVGGIVAHNSGTISNCNTTNYINIEKDDAQTGGVAGCNYGTISNCANRINISGNGDIGGIVGVTYGGVVSNCYNYGSINYYFQNPNKSIGGIVGYQHAGSTTNNQSYCYVAYASPSCNSHELQPNMAFIVGHVYSGEVSGNTFGGTFNPGTLHTETWKTGVWPFQTTHTHDQAAHAGAREIGWDER